MPPLPQYVCAILHNRRGEVLLECRPADAAIAAGRWTCFGGRREVDEAPEAALRRELSEELGWQPGPLTPVVALWVGGELIAWFYAAECDLAVTELRLEPGRSARWVGPQELAGTPLSPWHAATLHAWRSGEAVVSLPD